jgi:hypothetical protein
MNSNPVVRAWGNYFLKGNCKRIFAELDLWLRNRVTAFKLKRQGGYGHRKYPYSKLQALGYALSQRFTLCKATRIIPCNRATSKES